MPYPGLSPPIYQSDHHVVIIPSSRPQGSSLCSVGKRGQTFQVASLGSVPFLCLFRRGTAIRRVLPPSTLSSVVSRRTSPKKPQASSRSFHDHLASVAPSAADLLQRSLLLLVVPHLHLLLGGSGFRGRDLLSAFSADGDSDLLGSCLAQAALERCLLCLVRESLVFVASFSDFLGGLLVEIFDLLVHCLLGGARGCDSASGSSGSGSCSSCALAAVMSFGLWLLMVRRLELGLWLWLWLVLALAAPGLRDGIWRGTAIISQVSD
ncbi:hypothetical protein B0T19DRAFT_425433 [Cercophora scortea]|uniref:Uncharacterized protein n=1 Tax=Cercophora scortea TaxID=314031 RepID=A0AAE0IFB3_9PEZI|nr:hypothetical protein B0T19DRAFT_425433 [Cercophora scortea]